MLVALAMPTFFFERMQRIRLSAAQNASMLSDTSFDLEPSSTITSSQFW